MWTTPMYNTTKLTLELRDLVESGVDIWNFEYPSFYTGEDKLAFEKKVIDHYYFRQIGQETTGRFLHYFRARIREIMPYYIRMYESVKLMDDLENPFDNVDVTETFEEETTGTASGTSSDTSSSKASGTSSGTSSSSESGTEQGTRTDEKTATEDKEHRFSNTPQGSISNLDSYMTEAFRDDNATTENVTGTSSGTSSSESSTTSSGTSSSESSGTSSGTSSSESSGTVKHTLTRKGNQGVNTYAHDIMEYRKSLIDVDMMIINNLQDLFLGVY